MYVMMTQTMILITAIEWR